jgi:hypothetical protein
MQLNCHWRWCHLSVSFDGEQRPKAPASENILLHLLANSIWFWCNWIVTDAGALLSQTKAPVPENILFQRQTNSKQFWCDWIVTNAGAILQWKVPASKNNLFCLLVNSIWFWSNWIVTDAGATSWWRTSSKGTCVQEYFVHLLVNITWFWDTAFSVMLVPVEGAADVHCADFQSLMYC